MRNNKAARDGHIVIEAIEAGGYTVVKALALWETDNHHNK